MLRWPDRVLQVSITTGTGPLALTDTVDGFQAFSDAEFEVGDTAYGAVFAVDANNVPTGDWASGLLTYSAANQITITTIDSSNVGSAVTWQPGRKWVMVCPISTNLGEWATALLAANNLSDLDDAATARTNLGLGTAAGFDIEDVLQSSLNLSDIPDAPQARANLGVDTAIEEAIAAATGNQTSDGLVSGGVVAWQSAYIYQVSAAVYYIAGVRYESLAQTVALAAADATNDRIDVLALDTNGDFVAITGTPAAQPSEPGLDPGTQLRLSIVLVVAATTEPPAASDEDIYLENTEWTSSTSGSGFNPASTTNPHTGTKDLEGTNVAANAYAHFTRGSAIVSDDFDLVTFYVRPKAAWNKNRGLRLQFYDGSVAKGSAVNFATATWGFVSATLAYQFIAIPLSQFILPSGTSLDGFRLTDYGGAIGFYIDDIQLKSSGASGTPTPTSGITQDQADARYLQLTGGETTGDIVVPDEAYGAGWNGSREVATKNALYDKIEGIIAGIPGSYSDEQAQDAVGAMVDTTIVYTDGTPLLSRAALTGDVTASAGSNALTIANGAVSLAKQADMATASVVYRKTAGSGAPEVQTLATLKTDLGLTGTNSGDQTTIAGITGTKAQFDTACSDGNFLYVGDITQYTAENARDDIGAALTDTGLAVVTPNDGADTIDINVPAASAGTTSTGTSTTEAVTPDGLAGSIFGTKTVTILVSDPAGSAITVGDGAAYWRVPSTLNGMNLVAVAAALTTVSSSGIPTVQIYNLTQTADMLTTKLTIDASETDSSTAATAAVIDAANDDVATGNMLRIDIDVAGTGAKGLMVEMQFQIP